MKLLRYGPKGDEKPGLLDPEGRIRDLSGYIPDVEAAYLGRESLARLRAIDWRTLPVAAASRLAPVVADTGKLICVGLNYSDHAAESGMAVPGEPVLFMKATSAIIGPNDAVVLPRGSVKSDWEVELGVVIGTRARYVDEAKALDHVAEMGREPPAYQYWFNKQRTCVVGPGATIIIPDGSHHVDYEGELAVVIGRRCRHVSAERALEVVAGYCVMNDVSVRDWQARTPTFTLGKSYDSHGPLGPCLVTTDEVPDPQALRLRTWVNDELRQDSTTADMIFSVAEQIACLSEAFTLEAGDVITTGTPAGVGAGFDPPRWLVPGDVVRIEVEQVGTLTNPVGTETPDGD